ncbi:MAG TPA: SUMF1/EgtB/PvdO family nonheme iron enzyme [Xanthobacteraceae bacterium]|nr:SUMF1/EgtB/PvdO family nonheme iron enzyme [Xanthobacteraceae bacterium]
MPRIFLSHSSANNAHAVVLYDWLQREGWKDEVFLDLDPKRGIVAGERWERKLNESANRCEAVLFLVSNAWISSVWCRKELNIARHLNKRLFGVLIEDLKPADVPEDLTDAWQVVRLASGRDGVLLTGTVPITHEEVFVTFSAEGLQRLKYGLEQAGLAPKFFAWPPADDPNRPPYRGLRPLEAEDAGIFFGRDAAVIEALDRLRGMRDGAPPRLFVIIGASGSGKSSFLRAGLLPRLARDDRNFFPLPVIRPNRTVISGDNGLLVALEGACRKIEVPITRADLRQAIDGGAPSLRKLWQTIIKKVTPTAVDQANPVKPPTIVVAIDQGEELFLAEGQDEARKFLALMREMVAEDEPALIVLFTIRSDAYERLQLAKELEGVHQETISLPPMPRGSYAEVIKGPAKRLEETPREIQIEDSLVDALLVDVDKGGSKDALPLLAFTLERLYLEYGGRKRLMLADYETLGRIKGSIEAAVEGALKAADNDPAIPKDRTKRLALLRNGLIPWLASIDPENGEPRRRIAALSEIPAESRPLIQFFVEQRLLATDISEVTGEQTIEPAHEALLRQWSLLRGWLADDTGLLRIMEAVKRASKDWASNGKTTAWLTHNGSRLEAAERLGARKELAAGLGGIDRAYLAACRMAETAAVNRRRVLQALIYVLLIGIIGGLLGWINQASIIKQVNWYTKMRPYMASVRPYVLAAETERSLKPQATFRECAEKCPEMIVIQAGDFTMGSPVEEEGRLTDEGPQHHVVILKPFAVSKYVVTFADWDACASVGGCPPASDSGFGRGTRPAINVSWDDAEAYVAWFAAMTGKPYRLLTEAEWEYVARAGTTTAYSWGNDIGVNKANCFGCGSQWDNKETAPVGSFKANPFGLYDVHGNVWEWVQDCYHTDYNDAPADSSPWTKGDCSRRVRRGGGWSYVPRILRSASRGSDAPVNRSAYIGFRLARTLNP